MRFDLPTVAADEPGFWTRLWLKREVWLPGAEVPLYKDIGVENGKSYEEVMIALNGAPTRILKVNAKGETIICFAVPIQRMRAVFGALLMTTRDGEIDDIIAKENGGILRIALLVVARHAAAVRAARAHHRRADAPSGHRRRTGPPQHQDPRADPRFQRPQGRNRPSVAGAARHDVVALQPHRRHREFRRRRRPRARRTR